MVTNKLNNLLFDHFFLCSGVLNCSLPLTAAFKDILKLKFESFEDHFWLLENRVMIGNEQIE